MADILGLSLPLVLTIAGVALCIGEALAPGAHLIVLGVALLAAGLIGLAVPALAQPIVAAGLVLGIGAATLYVYRTRDFYGGKGVARTRDSDSLVGQEGEVVEPVTQASGRVELYDGGFDPVYAARSIDGEFPVGTRVIVIDPGGGNVLTVEAVGGVDDIDRELDQARESSRDRDRESESTSNG